MSEKRRNLSTFQVHLMLTVAVVTLGFAGVIALALFVPLAMQLGRPDLDPAVMGGIARHALDMHGGFWPVVLVSVAASVSSGLLLYRRMTGPLFRFVNAFDRIGRGEVPEPIVLRKADYLHFEADAFNEMLVCLRERTGRVAAAGRAVERIADDLESTPGLGAEGVDLVRDLREAVKGLH